MRGPSPRIRGESVRKRPNVDVAGTIPANTGRIRWLPCQCHVCWDHPREYGENPAKNSTPRRRDGPSPRIRGEYTWTHRAARTTGTIPANTGRITSSVMFGTSGTDHPREYGENVKSGINEASSWGPSPRIRGEFASLSLFSARRGTIPANTGRIE